MRPSEVTTTAQVVKAANINGYTRGLKDATDVVVKKLGRSHEALKICEELLRLCNEAMGQIE